MNMEPRTLETKAEAALAEAYETVRDTLPGGAGVAKLRTEAFDAFRAKGLPHRRVEEWKYSDLRARLKDVPAFAARRSDTDAKAVLASAGEAYAAVERHRLIIVDGHYHPELSDVTALANEGVTVRSFAEALAADGETLLELPVVARDDAAVGLNAIFCADGLDLVIADGAALTKPLEIVHVSGGEAISTAERVLIRAGAKSEAVILQTFVGGAQGTFSNTLTDIRAGQGAGLTVARLQTEAPGTTHIATATLTLAEAAQVKLICAGIGSGFCPPSGFCGL